MSKHQEINSGMLSKQLKDLEPLELMFWAFERGYKLGKHDMGEGIHIKTSELKRQLTEDIIEYINNKQHSPK